MDLSASLEVLATSLAFSEAREVMQLFSIGSVMLNEDGSEKLDERGAPIPSYDNEDIMTFASVFTGLDRQPMRSNIEVVKSSGQGRSVADMRS